MKISIEEYQAGHGLEVMALWNAVLGASFPLTLRVWEQNVDLDAEYSPGDCLLARDERGRAAGLVLTRVFRHFEENPDMAGLKGEGQIAALVVSPEHQGKGIGSELLLTAERKLRREGAVKIRAGVGPFMPGPPVRCDRALRFWERHGYRFTSMLHDVRRDLRAWVAPPPPDAILSGEYSLGRARPGEEEAVIAFLRRVFPGGWRYVVSKALQRGWKVEDIIVLRDRGERIQGFLCSWHRDSPLLASSVLWYPLMGERFGGMGPLGIAPEARGKGLGQALVAAGATELQRRGVEECVIDWLLLVEFYGRAGFQIFRSYWMGNPKEL